VGLKLAELIGQGVSLSEVPRSGVLCVLAEGAAAHLPIPIRPPSLPLPLLDHLQVEVILIVEQDVPAWGLCGWLDGCVKAGLLL
jgi:hypothetical protein